MSGESGITAVGDNTVFDSGGNTVSGKCGSTLSKIPVVLLS